MKLKDLWGWIKGQDIRIGYSDGPAFDPADQERTDAMEDIRKNKDKRKEKQDAL
jgi:hypothetical protein